MSIRRRMRIPVMIPIASMGDIAFLLIIFFMLTSNFVREAHVKLDPARAVELAKVKPGTVTVSLDEEGELWLQGERVAKQALEYSVTALLQDKEDKLVVLKVHREAKESDYGPVLMALSKAGAKIGLIGREKER